MANKRKRKPLQTVDDVVAALGGPNETALIVNRSRQSVWLWRKAGTFPRNLRITMRLELRRYGLDAVDGLWK